MSEAGNSDTVTDLESIIAYALSQPVQDQQNYQRVHINIHSIRKRPADTDGISAKAAIDGIVEAGVLDDDNCKIVKAVTHSQEKTESVEFTEIDIVEVI